MLGLDQRVLRTAWTLFVFALVLATIYKIRHTVLLFALALLFAHLLSPLVDRVHWIIPPTGSRAPAILIVYLVAIGILIAIAIPMGSRIATEASALAAKFPETLKTDPLANVPLPHWLEPMRPTIADFIRNRIQDLSNNLVPMLSKASLELLSRLAILFSAVLVPILAFFVLKDGISIRQAALRLFHGSSRIVLERILTDLHNVLAQYMRALILLAAATFVSYVSFLALTHAPYPLLLAGIAAMLEVIPVIGPLAGAATIIIVSAISGYSHLVLLLIFLLIYRIFQDYILNPFLMSEGVEIHPLLVLLGVLAGEQIGGVPGMFFSVPVIATLKVILGRVWEEKQEPI